MINLTGKDLSGLARGTEIFKSVKRADARLNSDEVDGFTDLAEMTGKENAAYPGKCPKCKGPLTKHPSGPYGGMPFCAGCGEVWDPEDIKNDDQASMYPHDILPNTKDGVSRGNQRYGERKNGWQCLECGKKFSSAAAAERAAMSDRGCPGCGGSDIDDVSEK